VLDVENVVCEVLILDEVLDVLVDEVDVLVDVVVE
jgi:hypothetical protein